MSTKGFRTPRTPIEFVEAAGSLTTTSPAGPGAPIPATPRPTHPPAPASAPAPFYAPAPGPDARVKRQVNFDLAEPDHRRLSEMVESMSGRMSIRKFIVAAVLEKMERIENERSR